MYHDIWLEFYFLIATRVQTQIAESTDCCILSHFVGSPTTFSADVVQILRRFTNLVKISLIYIIKISLIYLYY